MGVRLAAVVGRRRRLVARFGAQRQDLAADVRRLRNRFRAVEVMIRAGGVLGRQAIVLFPIGILFAWLWKARRQG